MLIIVYGIELPKHYKRNIARLTFYMQNSNKIESYLHLKAVCPGKKDQLPVEICLDFPSVGILSD